MQALHRGRTARATSGGAAAAAAAATPPVEIVEIVDEASKEEMESAVRLQAISRGRRARKELSAADVDLGGRSEGRARARAHAVHSLATRAPPTSMATSMA
eukprot:3176364-Prymnesium_polylepis.1